jgi:hypothetical protein
MQETIAVHVEKRLSTLVSDNYQLSAVDPNITALAKVNLPLETVEDGTTVALSLTFNTIFYEWHKHIDEFMSEATFLPVIRSASATFYQISNITTIVPTAPKYVHYTLTGGRTSSDNGLQVVVELTREDMNAIKLNEQLLVDKESAWLRLTPATIKDMNGNSVVEIVNGKAMQASQFARDSIRPRLHTYDLNMTSQVVTLVFNETMNTSSVAFGAFTFMTTSNGAKTHTLTDGEVLTDVDSTTIQFKILRFDMNVLKQKGIGLGETSTFLEITSDAIADQAGHQVQTLTRAENAKRVDGYTADVTSPVLETFDLDLHDRTITLRFSETVKAMSLAVGELTVQSMPNGNNGAVEERTLTDVSSTSSVNGPVIVVDIGDADFDEIARLKGLATEVGNTFVRITESLITDTAVVPNKVVPIDIGAALEVTDFASDNVRPSLVSFSLNLTSELMVLQFDETVNVSSLDETQITIYNVEDGPSEFNHTLQNVTVRNADATFVEFLLSTEQDLNRIKWIRELAVDPSSTFLAITSLAIADMAGNPVEAKLAAAAMPVEQYFEDKVRPVLKSFELSVDGDGLLTLCFRRR